LLWGGGFGGFFYPNKGGRVGTQGENPFSKGAAPREKGGVTSCPWKRKRRRAAGGIFCRKKNLEKGGSTGVPEEPLGPVPGEFFESRRFGSPWGTEKRVCLQWGRARGKGKRSLTNEEIKTEKKGTKGIMGGERLIQGKRGKDAWVSTKKSTQANVKRGTPQRGKKNEPKGIKMQKDSRI